jgi:hypothetical protein
VLGNVLEVPVPLRRVGVGRRTRHRRRPGWHDHSSIRRVLPHGLSHAGLIIGAIRHESVQRRLDLVQQGTDLRSIIDIVIGQSCRHDPAARRIEPGMQLLPGTPALGSVFCDQPLARPAQRHAQ